MHVISVIERFNRIVQNENETIMQFIERYNSIEIEIPRRRDEAQKIGDLFLKFKSDISFAINTQTTLPHTNVQLLNVARRIEE